MGQISLLAPERKKETKVVKGRIIEKMFSPPVKKLIEQPIAEKPQAWSTK